MRTATTGYLVRPFRDQDESGVLDLLEASLGGGPAGARPAEYFRWKHFENPFGDSFMLVAQAGERIIGLRAFMRWEFRASHRTFRAVRAVDTATHPDYQGRGVFSRLTTDALELLREDVDFVFNTPNEKSLPGYLKMGWRIVGKVPVAVRVRRAIRFTRRMGSLRSLAKPASDGPPVEADQAGPALDHEPRLWALLSEAAPMGSKLATPRTVEYLRWRFERAPLLDYRAVREERGGELRGIAFFRVRPRGRLWETTVADLIVRPGDRGSAGRLLRRVARSARVDHVACSFPPGSAAGRGASRAGFVRAPLGMTLTVKALRERLTPDPFEMRSWSLSLGDLEVF